MQQVNILQLKGTGDDENAWEIAQVFASYEEAIEYLKQMKAEDEAEYGEAFWTLGDNARVEVFDVIDNNWGY